MLEDGKIDKPELQAICQSILQQLHIDQNLDFILNNYEAILPIKNKGTSDWGYAWIPVIGPAAGAAIGAFILTLN